jgi:predicted HTH domain antitoxin
MCPRPFFARGVEAGFFQIVGCHCSRDLTGDFVGLPDKHRLYYINGIMQVTVELPDQLARQWGETPDAVGRHVVEDAAIESYREGRISHRQVGEMLGLDYWQTESFLNNRGVPLNYTAADLEADNVTLATILAES